MDEYKIVIASDVDRDDVFVEINHGGEIIAEISKRDGDKIVTLFAPRNGLGTTHVCRDLLAALSEAERVL
jgi:hypothetical protein